jgi:hypothetical protein
VTRDRLDLLFQHCADLGLDVDWSDLGDYRRGEYRHHERRIVLNVRLTRAQATACLAHELGHHRFGDTCSTPANERRAWEYGAAMLITPGEYRTAEDQVGPHLAALALELGVTPKLVDAWRRWWEKRGRWLGAQPQHPLHALGSTE